MTLFEAYDHLLSEVAALFTEISEEGLPVCRVWIMDNLVDKPRHFPCVVVEMDSSRLLSHGGGSDLSGEHDFTLWVLYKYSVGFRQSREGLVAISDKLLSIPRFYANEKVEYGVDAVFDVQCVVAKISGKVA
ncbi:hypothetical protein MASR1M36_08900 [Candidatus Cloacimonadaceae bacterium]